MTMLSELLEEVGREPGERLYGVYPAVVREVNDPQNKGRIRVACSAIASARSGNTRMKACQRLSIAAIRSRYSCTSLRELQRPACIPFCKSAIVNSSNSNGCVFIFPKAASCRKFRRCIHLR